MYALAYRTIEGSRFFEEGVLYSTRQQAGGWARHYARKFGKTFEVVEVPFRELPCGCKTQLDYRSIVEFCVDHAVKVEQS